jgi:hypothetical protein
LSRQRAVLSRDRNGTAALGINASFNAEPPLKAGDDEIVHFEEGLWKSNYLGGHGYQLFIAGVKDDGKIA